MWRAMFTGSPNFGLFDCDLSVYQHDFSNGQPCIVLKPSLLFAFALISNCVAAQACTDTNSLSRSCNANSVHHT